MQQEISDKKPNLLIKKKGKSVIYQKRHLNSVAPQIFFFFVLFRRIFESAINHRLKNDAEWGKSEGKTF